jgi:hypothetical protein
MRSLDLDRSYDPSVGVLAAQSDINHVTIRIKSTGFGNGFFLCLTGLLNHSERFPKENILTELGK